MFLIKVFKKSLNLSRMLKKRIALEYGRTGCRTFFQKPNHALFWRNKNEAAEIPFLTDPALSCQMTNI